MSVQQMTSPEQQPKPKSKRKRIRRLRIIIPIIFILCIIAVVVFNFLNIGQGSIIVAALGLVLMVITWAWPLPSDPPSPVQPNPIQVSVTVQHPSIPTYSISNILQETKNAIWYVPFRPNPLFTGREHLLYQLHTNLTQNKSTALTQAQAINGLGGIGKTQIAIEYAYRHRDEYHYVFWVNATSRETLIADYVNIAHLLQLPVQNEQDQNIVVLAVKSWLTLHNDCLLILDNADNLNIIDPFLPIVNTCHILITTRIQATNAIAQPIEVEKMDVQEGMLMLLRRASILASDKSLDEAKQEESEIAEKIVRAMDGLPLALDQAGAYIEETNCTLTAYLNVYNQRQTALLNRRGSYSISHSEPVATTWSLSIEQVERNNPLAADLIYCCAFLAPDDIPEDFFTEGAYHLSTLLQPIATDSFLLNEAIGELRNFSLIHHNPEAKTISIHRLVQTIIRSNMNDRTQKTWTERVVQVLNHVFPDNINVTTRIECLKYVTHVQAYATFIEQYDLTFLETAQLLNKTALFLQELSLYTEAEFLLQRALHIKEKVLGPEHPDTAKSFRDLARLNHDQGKYEQAEQCYQQALYIQEKGLGPEHPDTAKSFRGLAWLNHDQGKYEQAEPFYQRALHIRETVLGPDDPDTAESLNDLAALYNYQGKYEQAEQICQEALHIREKVLSADDPDIAVNLNDLGTIYEKQDKYKQAEPFFQQAFDIQERVFGPDHPATISTLNNLAILYMHQGKYKQAELLFQQILRIREKIYEPNHPEIARILFNLAGVYLCQGKFEQAELLLQQAIKIQEQVLRPDHPDKAASLSLMATLYIIHHEIEASFKELLLIYNRFLFMVVKEVSSSNHLNLLQKFKLFVRLYIHQYLSLIDWLSKNQGKYEQAESLYQQSLRIREQVLGPEHPDTADSLNSLALLYERQGKGEQAEPLYLHALQIYEQVLGPEHSTTKTIRRNHDKLLNKIKFGKSVRKSNRNKSADR